VEKIITNTKKGKKVQTQAEKGGRFPKRGKGSAKPNFAEQWEQKRQATVGGKRTEKKNLQKGGILKGIPRQEKRAAATPKREGHMGWVGQERRNKKGVQKFFPGKQLSELLKRERKDRSNMGEKAFQQEGWGFWGWTQNGEAQG